MGGSSLPASYRMSNLLTTCHRCNLIEVERNVAQAFDFGWRVRMGMDPERTPLLYRGRWALLTDEGEVAWNDPPA